MRLELKTSALLLALVVVAAFAIHTTAAELDSHKGVKAEGSGWINSTVMPNKSTFGFQAQNEDGKVKGNLQYNDHGAKIKVKGNVTMLNVNMMTMTAIFSGTAKITNATGTTITGNYTATAVAGKHGKGMFNITLSTGYTDGGKLGGGNIKIG